MQALIYSRLHEVSGTFLGNVCSLMRWVHLSALPAANDKHSMTATTGPVLSAFPADLHLLFHTAQGRYEDNSSQCPYTGASPWGGCCEAPQNGEKGCEIGGERERERGGGGIG